MALLAAFAGESPAVERSPRLGLALSGGGAKGLAHIGVLKVLEEAGLEVDCIAGTSMGAIIGSLYSIGYSPRELERIALGQNWRELLTDRISRRRLAIEEKEEDGRYVMSFPIDNFRVKLPSGLIAGQKLSSLLSGLTVQVHHVEDFRSLPVPFVCVATDLENGDAVVLDRGFLPDALRASMSIPTVFTPVELEGRLLVDGFLVRNLPAVDVRALGADIVIGVDVGAPLYTKQELNSFLRVTEQVVNFRGVEFNELQQALCDILIQPELSGFSPVDFERADSLIALGERAARAMLPRLRALADSLGRIRAKGLVSRRHELSPVERFNLTEIQFEGLGKVSRHLLEGRMQVRVPGLYSPAEVEEGIERAYGTHFFERITYRLEPGAEGSRLIVRVIEKSEDQFRFGIHYDSDRDAAILLNTTYRNVLLEGSRLLLSGRLSENPAFEGSFFVQTGWKPGISAGVALDYTKFDVMTYSAAGDPEANFEYSALLTELVAQTTYSNSFALGGALQHQRSVIESVIDPFQIGKMDYALLSVAAFAKYDTFDRSVYPHSGARMRLEVKLVTDLLTSSPYLPDMEPFLSYMLHLERAVPAGRRLTFPLSVHAGWLSAENVPTDYLIFIGGAYSTLNNMIPFMGLRFMERMATGALTAQAGMQYEFRTGRYVILRANGARTHFRLPELRNVNSLFGGLGLTLGFDSPVGPLEYTLMWGSERKDLLSFVNIGYRF